LARARPVFAGAAIWIGQGDWRHFVAGAGEMLPHIREGFRASAVSDPVLAARTRECLWAELEDQHTIGVGAHFPELELGRLRTGTVRRWCCQAGWNGRGQR